MRKLMVYKKYPPVDMNLVYTFKKICNHDNNWALIFYLDPPYDPIKWGFSKNVAEIDALYQYLLNKFVDETIQQHDLDMPIKNIEEL
jgi:hypothetical protein